MVLNFVNCVKQDFAFAISSSTSSIGCNTAHTPVAAVSHITSNQIADFSRSQQQLFAVEHLMRSKIAHRTTSILMALEKHMKQLQGPACTTTHFIDRIVRFQKVRYSYHSLMGLIHYLK